MTPKNQTFTFPDTGETIGIRKVSPMIIIRLREDFPPPTPPMQKVKIGDEEVLEANPAHPDYQIALEKYNQELELMVRKLVIRRGVIIEWTEERREAVKEFRKFYQDTYQKKLTESDEEVFIYYVCVGSDLDVQELITAILRRSQPTEEGVKDAAARFPGAVQRS